MDLLLSRLTLSIDHWVRLGLLASGTFVSLLCGFLFIRRIGGAFTTSLTAEGLVLVTLVALAACGVFRWSWLTVQRSSRGRTLWLWLGLPTLNLLLLVAAITGSRTPLWAVGISWLCLIASETAWWLLGLRRPRASAPSQVSGLAPESEFLGADEEGLPQGVTQQLTRARDPERGESIYGLVRAEFAPGELQQQVHVAFCPPFEAKPEIQAFVVDGPAANIKVAQLESFGTRIELRLMSHEDHEQSVVVEFEAVCSPR